MSERQESGKSLREVSIYRCEHCGDQITDYDEDLAWHSLGNFGGTGTGAYTERLWCAEAASGEHSPDYAAPVASRGEKGDV